MLPGKAIAATMLFLLYVRSGVPSSSSVVTPSPSPTTPAATSSANVSTNSSAGGGGASPSPNATTTGTQIANVTASVSVADGKWNVVNPVSVYYYKGRTLFWRGGGGMKSNKAQINCLHTHTKLSVGECSRKKSTTQKKNCLC